MASRSFNSKKKKSRRRALIKLFGNECFYCGTEMFLVDMMDDPKEATLDHIVPSCRGGSNKVSNIIMCCRKCNEERGHAEFEEYLSRVFFAHSEFERAKLESRYDIYVTQLSI